MANLYPQPFLKWAGGKRQLASEIVSHILRNFDHNRNTYYEPFTGGGAIFFELSKQGLTNAVLGDINSRLMTTYRVIRDDLSSLIYVLNNLAVSRATDPKEHFLAIRDANPSDDLSIAARMIYLNKCCFNGLYRENSKGQFNVPWNKKSNVRLFDPENLLAVSQSLRNVRLSCGEWLQVIHDAKPGDFVYFDPPYLPLHTGSFTKYNANDFSEKDHLALSLAAMNLKQNGVHVLISNSSSPYIRKLFSEFNVVGVQASRRINCVGNKRQSIEEVLIF